MYKTLLVTLASVAAVVAPAMAQEPPAHRHTEVAVAPATSEPSSYARATAQAMDTMHSAMMSAPVTGDPEHDFLSQMIPHHQGAVDMAKAVLGSSSDPAIRNIAQSIITEQTYEIALMRSMLAASAKKTAPAPETTP